jgi:putative ABC transport system permease protein
MAGAVFMMVLSTNYSFNKTIDDVFDSFGYDVILGFNNWQRIEEIVPLVESREHVEKAEMWMYGQGTLREVKPDETEGVKYAFYLRAIPRNTEMFTPNLTAGRNLQPDDGHALLLNRKLADEMGVTVGDRVLMDLDEEGESIWSVVGLISDLSGRQATAYIHMDTYSAEVNLTGRAGVIEIQSDVTGSDQKTLAKTLKDFLDARDYNVSFTYTQAEDQETAGAQFSILTTFLLIMTCLMAVVGSFGLSGTLSINVLERRREIGVMRAVGASSGDVGFIFMTEGLLLGVASWLVAIPISLLAGGYFVRAVGEAIDFPATYYYSAQGVWFWLAVVVVLSLLASWLPARRATQISVRESLAYE